MTTRNRRTTSFFSSTNISSSTVAVGVIQNRTIHIQNRKRFMLILLFWFSLCFFIHYYILNDENYLQIGLDNDDWNKVEIRSKAVESAGSPGSTISSKKEEEEVIIIHPSDDQTKKHIQQTQKSSQKISHGQGKGGIILFFHMPKTAGSSLRQIMRKNSDTIETIYYSNERTSMEDIKQMIHQWTIGGGDPVTTTKSTLIDNTTSTIQSNRNRTKFIELHWDLDSVIELQHHLLQWRTQAQQNNIPFFTFTIIRNDPLGAYLSYYNYFCTFQHKMNICLDCGPPPHDKHHMIRTSPDNPQIRWLCYATTLNRKRGNCESGGRGENGKNITATTTATNDKTLTPTVTNRKRRSVTEEECAPSLLQSEGKIQQLFDWIGTVENFQETLDVLQFYMGASQPLPYIHNNRVGGFKRVMFFHLNETEKQILYGRLRVDQELVDLVKNVYTLEHMGIEQQIVE